MLEESLHTDISIVTENGQLKAHKAVLASCSPVFRRMFFHDMKENESSTVEIDDMSCESCAILLKSIYGNIKLEEFWENRVMLLVAANKYDISELKETCEMSLLEDIACDNVLERLQLSWIYHVDKLKKSCIS